MSKLIGAAKHSRALFSGTRHVSGGKAHKCSAAKEASQQRPRAGDELGYEMLLQRIRSRRVVPFVGAGISMPLLPSWEQVLKKVAENLGMTQYTDKEKSKPVITEILREQATLNKYIASEQARKASEIDIGAASQDRQTYFRNVRHALSDEFLKVFEECICTKGNDTHVNVLTQGSTPTRWLNNPDLTSTLKLPLALMSGPWPLIMTTNWDTLLEAAYQHRYHQFLSTEKEYNADPLNVWDDDNPSGRPYHYLSATPQVRYRANVQQVFAELRAGLNPPRLLKLHGDFTERGRQEVVAGHTDYRNLMVHEVAFAGLMNYICSNYSLLFFGCSLTDLDLLATLDSMVESLGGEVGPHFWLTAEDVSKPRADFLRRHYSVFTVRTPSELQYTEAGNLLNELPYTEAGNLLVNACNKGWQRTRPLNFNALSFGMGSWAQGGPELRLIIENSMSEDVLKRSTSAVPVAAGLSCGCRKEGHPIFGSQGKNMLKHPSNLPQGKKFAIHDTSSLWRTMLWQEDLALWLVCGQDAERSGSLGSLFEAVQHFVQRASWKIYTGDLDPPADAYLKFYGDNVPSDYDDLLKQRQERREAAAAMLEATKAASNTSTLPRVAESVQETTDSSVGSISPTSSDEAPPPSRIVLCLPLLSAGGGLKNKHEVLSATVSAIGSIYREYLPPCPVDIILCLSTPDAVAQGARLALMADIQAGRVVIGDILSRSFSGHMEFTCIAPVADGDGFPIEDQKHWRCRRVMTSLDANLNDLRRWMDFIVIDDHDDSIGEQSLLSLNITDGSFVKLDAIGNIVTQ